MADDLGKWVVRTHRRRRKLATAHSPRPPERAQVVWQRAVELAALPNGQSPPEVALDLLRAAQRDASTMAHAMALGRTRLLADGGDADVAGGVDVLERAIRFLGTRPRTGDVA
ncbi:MAG TPA: hypothetical protein VFA11_19930 [Acidimicrobiales bacterium]|nr:hypothetical protein [Acidimicrobiales bacterium]